MSEVEENVDSSTGSKFGVRHIQVLLHVLFYAILYGIEISISLSIVDLINPDNKHSKTLASLSISDVSLLIQCYLIGFLLTSLFSASICKKYGFKWPMVIAMTHISIISIFLPTITKSQGFYGLASCRILQGLSAGLVYPMPADFISKWIPAKEKSTLGTAVYAGSKLGEALAMILWFYGSSNKKGDWPSFFLELGYITIFWVVLMVIFGSETPEKYTGEISQNELRYIISNRGNARVDSKVGIPWMRMCSSTSFWAIIVAQIGANWLYFILTSYIPLYLYEFYHLPRSMGGVAIVSLIAWASSFILGIIAKILINKEVVSTGYCRKLFNLIGCLIPSIFFVISMFEWQGEDLAGYFIWALMSISYVSTISGSRLNINDISSNNAPAILGISTWTSAIFAIIFANLLNTELLQGWRMLMGSTVVLLVLTNIFFIIFGKGEEQEWDFYDDLNVTEEEDMEKELSKSASYVSCDEKKYLLYVTKR